MAFQIPALDLLIHELTRLPGIGEKTAQRLAFFILREGPEYSQRLQDALSSVKTGVRNCPRCFSYTDQELCRICESPHRDPAILCIVEEPSDVIRMEAMGTFQGFYHVLQGTISPLDGRGPDDLRVQELLERLQGETPVKEVVLALDANLEGDTTALYLSKLLSSFALQVTRLAHGVPFGSDIDYIDQRTLTRAYENRVKM